MSDTASQNSPPRNTLQAEITFQTSIGGGKMTTFIITDKTGECVIPPFTNVRLVNCIIQSLSVSNGSIIYIAGGKVEGAGPFSVTNSAVLSEDATWNAPVTFSNSKVEINNSTVGRNLIFKTSSYLKSIGNIWQGTDSTNSTVAITATGNSRVDSSRDAWSQWNNYFWTATDNSIIKIINPSRIDHSATPGSGKGLSTADSNSVVVVSHAEAINVTGNNNALFTCTKNSRVELYNISSLIADGMIFSLDTSRAIVRNIDNVTSNKNKVGNLNNSKIDFSSVSAFQSGGSSSTDLFTLINSSVNFSSADSFKAKGTVFSLNQSNINFVSNSFDYNSNPDDGATIESSNNIAITATGSKIFMKYLNLIKSDTNQAISLTNSIFKGSDITNINGGNGSGIITATGSYLTLVNVNSVSGSADNGIYLTTSKGSFLNVASILGQGAQGNDGAGIHATSSSSVVCRGTTTVQGPDHGIFLEDHTTLIFKGNNVTAISGSGKSGVSVGTSCRANVSNIQSLSSTSGNGIDNPGTLARVELRDIKTITGNNIGINMIGGDLLFDNSGVLNGGTVTGGSTGIQLASAAPLGTYKAVLVGPTTVTGSVALAGTNYQIEEQGITWNGDVVTTNCLTKNTLSTTSGATTNVGSHSDHLRTSLGDLSLSQASSFKLRGSSVSGATSLDQSLLELVLSTIGAASLSNRAGTTSEISDVGDVTLVDSYIRSFGSNTGTVSLSGVSTAFGGASQSANLNFASGDASYSSPVGYFVVSSGDLDFQADNDVNIEALDFDASVRNNIVFDAPAGQVLYTGESDLVITVGGSSITVTTSSIALVSASITEN